MLRSTSELDHIVPMTQNTDEAVERHGPRVQLRKQLYETVRRDR